MSQTLTEATVGELVTERPGRARVFERLGIDYCCGGKKPLSQACGERGLEVEQVLEALREADARPAPAQPNWAEVSMTELCDHIESTHHAYLRQELPRLEMLSRKVADRHGEIRPALREVADVFAALKQELEFHMMKEERVLFPMCRQLDEPGDLPAFHCGSVQNPIAVMVQEHDSAGHALERFRQVTENYRLPAEACNSYRALFEGLETLEGDLHQHIHKENNILFPRAVAAEAARRG